MIKADWPAPTWIYALTTTCQQREGTFADFNLSHQVGKAAYLVERNRQYLSLQFNLRHQPCWLTQVHSTCVIQATDCTLACADGAWTQQVGLPCVVLSADCLPLLLCDSAGTLVAALHCGWRGLLAGIIEQALIQIQSYVNGELLAWLGPAIGPEHFEVSNTLMQAFIDKDPDYLRAFKSAAPGKKLANIYQLAKISLEKRGVSVYGGNYCTYSDQRFYSYRRQPQTGRMATLIWINSR